MIRVALIGAGFMGRNHFNQYEKLTDRVELVALCDKEAKRRKGDWSDSGGNLADDRGTRRDLGDVKCYADWQEIVDNPDIDLVDICVPTPLHPEITVTALAAGKHVLCEKPMALTVEACDDMLAVATNSTGRFMIAQCVRFWPEYVYLKRICDAGTFGQLKVLNLRRQASPPDYSLGNWALDPEVSGGAVLDLHVHDVDYAIGLLGKPESVYAQGYQQDTGAVDCVHALWQYPSGPAVEIVGTWDLPEDFGFNMGFTAVFDEASIVWDMNMGAPLTVLRPGSEAETPELPADDGYFAEIEHFITCIERNEEPTISTPAESRDAVAIALAEKQSALTGKPVRIT